MQVSDQMLAVAKRLVEQIKTVDPAVLEKRTGIGIPFTIEVVRNSL